MYRKNKIDIVTMGCSKNLIDSERLLRRLAAKGYETEHDPDTPNGEYVVVNTCGFIGDAKEESVMMLLELAELKKKHKIGHIVVMGCLSERYRDSLPAEMPEVDTWYGKFDWTGFIDSLPDLSGQQTPNAWERDLTTPPHSAYLKISEGCNRFCAFCAIPFIRGRYRSRPMENILEEARELAAHGVKELIVIAQDITRYGTDLYGKRSLAALCRELGKIEGVEWIRLHYLYPDQFDDELIDEIASNDKIVKYLDIPIQHINDAILKRMNRRGTGSEIRALFRTLRERIPGLVLRTSLIAGLPGEGEAEFEELCEFLKEARIERAGVFPFSPEEGTPAAKMEHVDAEEAQKRADLILQLQAEIMDEFCESFVGKTIRVLCQSFDEDSGLLVGRSYADSPDIDGLVFFEGSCPPGEMADVRIDETDDGYLYGTQTGGIGSC